MISRNFAENSKSTKKRRNKRGRPLQGRFPLCRSLVRYVCVCADGDGDVWTGSCVNGSLCIDRWCVLLFLPLISKTGPLRDSYIQYLHALPSPMLPRHRHVITRPWITSAATSPHPRLGEGRMRGVASLLFYMVIYHAAGRVRGWQPFWRPLKWRKSSHPLASSSTAFLARPDVWAAFPTQVPPKY